LARLAGGVAVGISAVIAFLLVFIANEGVNLLSGATLVGTAVGGGLAIAWPDRRWVVVLGGLLIIVAIYPALIGGVGLLYVPSAVGLGVAAALIRR